MSKPVIDYKKSKNIIKNYVSNMKISNDDKQRTLIKMYKQLEIYNDHGTYANTIGIAKGIERSKSHTYDFQIDDVIKILDRSKFLIETYHDQNKYVIKRTLLDLIIDGEKISDLRIFYLNDKRILRSIKINSPCKNIYIGSHRNTLEIVRSNSRLILRNFFGKCMKKINIVVSESDLRLIFNSFLGKYIKKGTEIMIKVKLKNNCPEDYYKYFVKPLEKGNISNLEIEILNMSAKAGEARLKHYFKHYDNVKYTSSIPDDVKFDYPLKFINRGSLYDKIRKNTKIDKISLKLSKNIYQQIKSDQPNLIFNKQQKTVTGEYDEIKSIISALKNIKHREIRPVEIFIIIKMRLDFARWVLTTHLNDEYAEYVPFNPFPDVETPGTYNFSDNLRIWYEMSEPRKKNSVGYIDWFCNFYIYYKFPKTEEISFSDIENHTIEIFDKFMKISATRSKRVEFLRKESLMQKIAK